jgi:hypothetical protein
VSASPCWLCRSASPGATGRTSRRWGVGACAAAISLWTVIAALVFSKGTVDDLSFASAVAIGALAVVGLTAHELEAEHAVEGTPSAA